MSLEAKNYKGRSLPLPRFLRFYVGETTEGTGTGGNRIEQGQGNREDGVRPGSQGPRGFLWSPSLCGVPRCREGGVTRMATLSFRKVGATSPSRWSIGGSKCPAGRSS